jgi:mRNA interferase MazF
MKTMKRGDIVSVAMKGAYTGKPRPALIVQSDVFGDTDSITICLLTGDKASAPLGRIDVVPTKQNGLKIPCSIMIDKIVTVPRAALGKRIGKLDAETMMRMERSLALFLGIV